MKKILQISMGQVFGGIEKLELDYVKNIDNSFQIDLLAPNINFFEKYKNDVKSKLWNSYSLDIDRNTRKNKWIYDYRLFKFLKKHKYDIVHINSEIFFFSFRVVLIAKLCGVKKIIVHSHGCTNDRGLKRLFIIILNPIYRCFIDDYLTCSKLAAESLFTKGFIKNSNVKLIKNGIEVNEFSFDESIRKEYRSKLSLKKKIVYGHIGRFSKEKNHDFLIDIFFEIQKTQKNAVLLLVGTGRLEEQIKNKVEKLRIDDKVLFLGFREDSNKILNAMDIFIFPSLNEGLGLSAIEAQTNGLITYCSKNIPKEANISPYFKTFDLSENPSSIAKMICNDEKINHNRKYDYKYTIGNGYDIKEVCKTLETIYNKVFKK